MAKTKKARKRARARPLADAGIEDMKEWSKLDRRCKEATGYSAQTIALNILADELDPTGTAPMTQDALELANLIGSEGDLGSRLAAAAICRRMDQTVRPTRLGPAPWDNPTKILLDGLSELGLFGKTRSEVIERLVQERLRQLILEGWISKP